LKPRYAGEIFDHFGVGNLHEHAHIRLIHKNAAARYKSRLSAAIKRMA
jgi:ribosomal protein S20